jgi:pyruvate,orthophosphate dikinase
MTADAQESWSGKIGSRSAFDCRRRLVQMLGATAYGIDSAKFEAALTQARFKAKAKEDRDLDAADLSGVCAAFEDVFKQETGQDFPETVEAQLAAAVEAVFRSWNNERAKTYRKLNGIDDSMGTAVTVQTMVFGNLNDDSGSGVLFTRHPSTGKAEIMGEFLPNAQGEDVVAGIRTPLPLSKLNAQWPEVGEQIAELCDKLEIHYRDMMDVEFTVQDRKLFLLQCRVGKRSSLAKLQIAFDFLTDNVIDLDTALSRFSRKDVRLVLQPQVDPAFKDEPNYVGIGSTQGVARGIAVLTAEDAINCKEPCILVRDETDPDDIGGMAAAVGILTRTGGATSHAAVVARAMNKPAVVGCTSLPEHLDMMAGKKVTIDGASGKVWVGVDVPVIDVSKSPVVMNLAELIAQRDGLTVEVSPDQFGETEDGTAVLLTGVPATFGPCNKNIVVDLRHDKAAKDADGLRDLFALAPEPESLTPITTAKMLADSGVRVLADGKNAAALSKLGCKIEGPASSFKDMLDRKTLDVAPSVVVDYGAADWPKLASHLEKAGFTKSQVTAAPPAYILMAATTEG